MGRHASQKKFTTNEVQSSPNFPIRKNNPTLGDKIFRPNFTNFTHLFENARNGSQKNVSTNEVQSSLNCSIRKKNPTLSDEISRPILTLSHFLQKMEEMAWEKSSFDTRFNRSVSPRFEKKTQLEITKFLEPI